MYHELSSLMFMMNITHKGWFSPWWRFSLQWRAVCKPDFGHPHADRHIQQAFDLWNSAAQDIGITVVHACTYTHISALYYSYSSGSGYNLKKIPKQLNSMSWFKQTAFKMDMKDYEAHIYCVKPTLTFCCL